MALSGLRAKAPTCARFLVLPKGTEHVASPRKHPAQGTWH